jgi:hypothetical protein
MRHWIAWPRGCIVSCSDADLREAVGSPGDADLRLHEVDAGDLLGHRVLDLQPRVDLDEVVLGRPATRNSTVPALW